MKFRFGQAVYQAPWLLARLVLTKKINLKRLCFTSSSNRFAATKTDHLASARAFFGTQTVTCEGG